MELIILGVFISFMFAVDSYHKFRLNRCRNYNNGYHKGFEDSIKQATDMAECANKELCNKYETQFKVLKNDMPPSETIKITEGVNPLNYKTTTFYAETYSISFYLEPNRDGYITLNSDKTK